MVRRSNPGSFFKSSMISAVGAMVSSRRCLIFGASNELLYRPFKVTFSRFRDCLVRVGVREMRQRSSKIGVSKQEATERSPTTLRTRRLGVLTHGCRQEKGGQSIRLS